VAIERDQVELAGDPQLGVADAGVALDDLAAGGLESSGGKVLGHASEALSIVGHGGASARGGRFSAPATNLAHSARHPSQLRP
jgi:hypothetical protein